MYHLIHTCGHEEAHALPNSWRTAQEIERLEAQVCSACYKAQQAAKDAVNVAAVAELALPVLSGSEKQIAWAEKIRAGVAATILPLATDEASRQVVAQELTSETTARYWIDNRGRDVVHYVVLAIEAARLSAQPVSPIAEAAQVAAETTLQGASTETIVAYARNAIAVAAKVAPADARIDRANTLFAELIVDGFMLDRTAHAKQIAALCAEAMLAQRERSA